MVSVLLMTMWRGRRDTYLKVNTHDDEQIRPGGDFRLEEVGVFECLSG